MARLSPGGIRYGIVAIGKIVSLDLALESPIGGRRLIDGATGRARNPIKAGERTHPRGPWRCQSDAT